MTWDLIRDDGDCVMSPEKVTGVTRIENCKTAILLK